MRVEDPVARGWDALADTRWDDARSAFEDALAVEETSRALEGLAWAAFWIGDAETVFRARERAHVLYREAGDRVPAARTAIWLGCDHIDFRGEEAIAQGWYARAERLLEGVSPQPEHGWLAF